MRQVVLDTETTGLETERGHRIVEIGAVELVDRRLSGRRFHKYVNPQRDIDEGAQEVHGISSEFLEDKPRIGEIWSEFLEFIDGAELIIHNAPFDVGFMDHEFAMHGPTASVKTKEICGVLDTLVLARDMHPGQKNNLDALCKRYGIDNSHRELHGALLDAEILADVYLMMTGGQTDLNLSGNNQANSGGAEVVRRIPRNGKKLKVIQATADELTQHEARLDLVQNPIWRQ